jgi:hypothetical protein
MHRKEWTWRMPSEVLKCRELSLYLALSVTSRYCYLLGPTLIIRLSPNCRYLLGNKSCGARPRETQTMCRACGIAIGRMRGMQLVFA